MREWARRDSAAAATVEVDAWRLRCARELFLAMRPALHEASTRSMLLYAYVFGVSMMNCEKFDGDIARMKGRHPRTHRAARRSAGLSPAIGRQPGMAAHRVGARRLDHLHPPACFGRRQHLGKAAGWRDRCARPPGRAECPARRSPARSPTGGRLGRQLADAPRPGVGHRAPKPEGTQLMKASAC